MTIAISSFDDVSDDDLLRHVAHLARQERHATAQLIASLTELDARKLYLREGCASLFTYCTQVLHLLRTRGLRSHRARTPVPEILELLADGAITLTTVTLLGPHLTDENHSLLEAARHKSRREVEQIVARVRPKPDIPASIRKLPEPTLAKSPTAPPAETSEVVDARPEYARPVAPARRPMVAPLAPARYKMQFTVSDETYQTFRRAQDLLRHTIPNGDPAAIVDRALTMLVEHLEKTKWAATTRPQASRGIPARITPHSGGSSRAVWARDGGQCTFVGAAGRARNADAWIPPRGLVCDRWAADGREHRVALPAPQPVRSGARISAVRPRARRRVCPGSHTSSSRRNKCASHRALRDRGGQPGSNRVTPPIGQDAIRPV